MAGDVSSRFAGGKIFSGNFVRKAHVLPSYGRRGTCKARQPRPSTGDKKMTTTITDTQIEQLRTEAGQAGDHLQVAICDRAIEGDEQTRAECARVIADAAAQQEGGA